MANLYPRYPVGHIVVNWAPITIEPYSTSCEYSHYREGRGFVCAFPLVLYAKGALDDASSYPNPIASGEDTSR